MFVNDAQLLAHSFQLYPDSAAVVRHWSLSDPYISDVMRHCTVESLQIYGQPNDEVAEGLSSMLSDGIVNFTGPHHVGFVRSPEVEAAPPAA
ncbi:hypothetical protein [Mycobacterium avium]|uniref:hypothetical protein n=1 Tax=Mycobacterium avium TaxID=1764 RepID=UPI00191C8A89|nr:hypothetical protein [Mycobacterium avium]